MEAAGYLPGRRERTGWPRGAKDAAAVRVVGLPVRDKMRVETLREPQRGESESTVEAFVDCACENIFRGSKLE